MNRESQEGSGAHDVAPEPSSSAPFAAGPGGLPWVVLVDGRSGAGKTTLASRLAPALGAPPAQILSVEDLYPGWDGLAEGAEALVQALLDGRYRAYDWQAGRLTGWRGLDPARPIIAEGCGALSRESLAAARGLVEGRAEWAPHRRLPRNVWSIWVECPDEARRARALERDGDVFRPHWERWARQEEELFARTRPRSLAHEIVHVAEESRGAPAGEPRG